jgi:NAD(P)H-nitrite reductase large subunit
MITKALFKVSAEGTSLKDPEFYTKNNIDLKTNTEVRSINKDDQYLELSNG